MAGKRPDQYRIAPAETLSTDYKTRPAGPQDAEVDDAEFSRAMEAEEGPWAAGRKPRRARSKARKSRKSL